MKLCNIVVYSIHFIPLVRAQPIDLETAATFGALGATTVTNTGPSFILGDLGVSPGMSITGFSQGSFSGTLHNNDAVAAQAQADALTAYTVAAGLAPTAVKTGMDLGGLALPRGVYFFSSSAQLTGTLTLNGQGDTSALFVFQVGSTLTTAPNSAVILINGAQACNVIWQVGSSATLGAGTIFIGNILAHTSISTNTGASNSGSLIALNGAVTLQDNDIEVVDTCSSTSSSTTTSTRSSTVSTSISSATSSTGSSATMSTISSNTINSGSSSSAASSAGSSANTDTDFANTINVNLISSAPSSASSSATKSVRSSATTSARSSATTSARSSATSSVRSSATSSARSSASASTIFAKTINSSTISSATSIARSSATASTSTVFAKTISSSRISSGTISSATSSASTPATSNTSSSTIWSTSLYRSIILSSTTWSLPSSSSVFSTHGISMSSPSITKAHSSTPVSPLMSTNMTSASVTSVALSKSGTTTDYSITTITVTTYTLLTTIYYQESCTCYNPPASKALETFTTVLPCSTLAVSPALTQTWTALTATSTDTVQGKTSLGAQSYSHQSTESSNSLSTNSVPAPVAYTGAGNCFVVGIKLIALAFLSIVLLCHYGI